MEQRCSRSVETNNFEKVFTAFKRHYKLVPLEVFGEDPYKTLISTILSARTRDETTLKVSKELFKVAPSLAKLKSLDIKALEKTIYPVGFYKTKARHLHELAAMTETIPNSRDGLMKLPGVGRKTANLVLNRAFNIPAIAVDTHVHRISNLLGWVHTKTPQETEKELVRILPKKYWSDTNRLFVSIGQQYRSEKKLKEFLKTQGLL